MTKNFKQLCLGQVERLEASTQKGKIRCSSTTDEKCEGSSENRGGVIGEGGLCDCENK